MATITFYSTALILYWTGYNRHNDDLFNSLDSNWTSYNGHNYYLIKQL